MNNEQKKFKSISDMFNSDSSYDKAFAKFEKRNEFSIFELATNELLRKKHYAKNANIQDSDSEEIQKIYEHTITANYV